MGKEDLTAREKAAKGHITPEYVEELKGELKVVLADYKKMAKQGDADSGFLKEYKDKVQARIDHILECENDLQDMDFSSVDSDDVVIAKRGGENYPVENGRIQWQARIGGRKGLIGGQGPSASMQLATGVREDPSFKQLAATGKGNASAQISLPVAAIIGNEGQAGAGMSTIPSDPERTGYTMAPTPALSLLDVMPQRTTSQDSVEYVQFDVTGEADYQLLEGDEKAEIGLGGDLVTANISTIAGSLPASRQALGDHNDLRSVIDLVLRTKVRTKLENEIINGDGSKGKIAGLIKSGTEFTPTADGVINQIGECITAMQDEGYNPGVVAMRAAQWFTDVASLRDSNGQYIIGNPGNPAAPTLWGGSIIKPSTLPVDKILIMDMSYITLLDRVAVQILVSDSHKDFFTRNLIMILCECRAGLEVKQKGAIRIITL